MKRFTIFGLALGLAMLATPYVSAQSNDEEPAPTPLVEGDQYVLSPAIGAQKDVPYSTPLGSFSIGLKQYYEFYSMKDMGNMTIEPVLDNWSYDPAKGYKYTTDYTRPSYTTTTSQAVWVPGSEYLYYNLDIMEDGEPAFLAAPGYYFVSIKGINNTKNDDTYAPIEGMILIEFPYEYNIYTKNEWEGYFTTNPTGNNDFGEIIVQFPNENVTFYANNLQRDAKLYKVAKDAVGNVYINQVYQCQTAWNITEQVAQYKNYNGPTDGWFFSLNFIAVDDAGNPIYDDFGQPIFPDNINEPTEYILRINSLETWPGQKKLQPIIKTVELEPIVRPFDDYYFYPGYNSETPKNAGYNTNINRTTPVQVWEYYNALNNNTLPTYANYPDLTTIRMFFPNRKNVYFDDAENSRLSTVLVNLTTGQTYYCASPEENKKAGQAINGRVYDFRFLPEGYTPSGDPSEAIPTVSDPGYYMLTVKGGYVQDPGRDKAYFGAELPGIPDYFFQIGHWPVGLLNKDSQGTNNNIWLSNQHKITVWSNANNEQSTLNYWITNLNKFPSFDAIQLEFPFSYISFDDSETEILLVNNTTGSTFIGTKKLLTGLTGVDNIVWEITFTNKETGVKYSKSNPIDEAGEYTLTIDGLYYIAEGKSQDYGLIKKNFILNGINTTSWPFQYNISFDPSAPFWREGDYEAYTSVSQLYNIYQDGPIYKPLIPTPVIGNGLMNPAEEVDPFDVMYFSVYQPNSDYPGWTGEFNGDFNLNRFDIAFDKATITLENSSVTYKGIVGAPKVGYPQEYYPYPTYNKTTKKYEPNYDPNGNSDYYPFWPYLVQYPIQFVKEGDEEPSEVTASGEPYILTISGVYYLYLGTVQKPNPVYAMYDIANPVAEPDDEGEGDTSAVGKIEAAQADSYNVYNLNGVQIISNGTANDLNSLDAGFYIVNGKKVVIRK